MIAQRNDDYKRFIAPRPISPSALDTYKRRLGQIPKLDSFVAPNETAEFIEPTARGFEDGAQEDFDMWIGWQQ